MLALANTLISYRDIRSKPILHGRRYEQVAVEKFEAKWGIHTEECGIFVCVDHPQLAASPDRIIDQDTVLEVKCPYANRDTLISAATVPYLKDKNGELTLDENHNYYFQVQGQLLCTNRKQCVFVVYTFRDIIKIQIERNEEFIQNMVEKLLGFYEIYFRPAFVNKCIYKNYYDYNFV